MYIKTTTEISYQLEESYRKKIQMANYYNLLIKQFIDTHKKKKSNFLVNYILIKTKRITEFYNTIHSLGLLIHDKRQ